MLFTCIETGREVVGGVVTGGMVKGGNVKEDPGGDKNAYTVKHPLTVHELSLVDNDVGNSFLTTHFTFLLHT